MSEQPVPSLTSFPFTRRVDLLVTAVALVARRPRARGIVALVDLGIGITQLDGDIALQLILETDGLHL
jgi:hypothetical protein